MRGFYYDLYMSQYRRLEELAGRLNSGGFRTFAAAVKAVYTT